MAEIDASLRRLGTDYVDLYQIHRWDPAHADRGDARGAARRRQGGQGALHRRLVDVGVAVQQGAATSPAQHGWTRFVSMQDHYNLLYREEEREMLPLCADQGVGVIPWSPLARGRLTRDWDEATDRSETDEFGKTLYDTRRATAPIVDAVGRGRRRRAASPGPGGPGLGAAPSRSSPRRSSAPPRPHHLDDAVAAVDLQLTDDEIAALEEPYTPHAVAGF